MCCASRATNGDDTVGMNPDVRALSEQNNVAAFFCSCALVRINMYMFEFFHMSTNRMFHRCQLWEKDGHTDHYVARVDCGSRLLWHVVSDHFHVMFHFPMFTIFPKLSMYINLQI